MATIKNSTARDVAADLIGNAKPKTTVVKGKATITKGNKPTERRAAAPARGRAAKYEPTMRIKVVKAHEGREDSAVGKIWKLITKSKTIGDYLKLRKANKLEGLGGIFGTFVSGGNIRVVK